MSLDDAPDVPGASSAPDVPGAFRAPDMPDVPDDTDPPRTVDVRLLPAAGVAWLAALLVTRVPATTALTVAGGLALAVGALVTRRRLRRSRPAPAVVLAVLTAVAVLAAGAGQTAAQHAGLLPQLARDGAVGRVEGVVVAEPTLTAPAWPGAPARVRCVVAVDRVRAGDRGSAATGHVLVLGPSSWSTVAFGARVSVTGPLHVGTPGQRTVAVVLTSAAPEVLRPPSAPDAAAARYRRTVRSLAQDLAGDAGTLLPGVTVGDTSAVPDDLTAALRSSGLTHVTAVSGAHFSLVSALVLALAVALRLPRVARVLLAAAAMACMVLVVHPSPSVLRAAVMGLVAVLGVLLGRPHRAPAALAATVVVLLLVDPWLAGEIGFVLSVLATGGLVLLGGPLAERWSPALGRPLATVLALPVSAQLLCAPAILLLTPTVALYAVPANVLAAPAVAPATLLGLAAGCVAPWWATGGQVLALGAGAACWWIGAVARLAAAAPGAQVAWLPGWAGVLVLALAGACALRVLAVARAPGCR